MTSPSDTDPPAGQRRPTLPGIPRPAPGAAPGPPTPVPATERESGLDMPAFDPACAEQPLIGSPLPPLPPRTPQDAPSPKHVRSVPPPSTSSRAGTVGRLLQALGPWAPLAILLVGLVWALGGGEGVAQVIAALRPVPPAEDRIAREQITEVRKMVQEVGTEQGLANGSNQSFRCAVAAILCAQGGDAPGLCDDPACPEGLHPAPLIRPGRVRKGAVIQPRVRVERLPE